MGGTCFSGVRTRLVFCSFGEKERTLQRHEVHLGRAALALFVRVASSEKELATRIGLAPGSFPYCGKG